METTNVNIADLANQLLGLQVKHVQELLEELKKHGIEPAAAPVVAAAPAAAQQAEEEEETKKAEVDLWITGFDAAKKLKLVTAVKAITGVGLVEAKKIFDNHKEAPIQSSLPRAKAEELAAKLKEAGATVELK